MKLTLLIAILFLFGCVSSTDPPDCPTALASVSSCSGLDPSVCPQKFQWSNLAYQCYLNTNAVCVASNVSCTPPCFPPGRNPAAYCITGNTSFGYCSTFTSTATSRYCIWSAAPPPYSVCMYGIACHKNLMNCPTATQAVANCSTQTTQTNCNAGFSWNTSPVQQCMWNSVSLVCTASSVQCIPPCLPPGRSVGTCSSKTTQLSCLQTTDITSKTYCAWTSGVCSNGLTCHT